jgi:hypothetical protein
VTNPADYISCKVLLQISRVVYHEVENGKETMERLLQSHYFQNVEFWEEYFWDVISNKYQKKFGDISEDYSKKEKEWLLKKMASFRTVLQDRGLPKDTLADLTKKLTDTIQADSDKLQSRKSENSLPKVFNRGIKSENSLPSLECNKLISVAEKRKSRMSCKKEIDSLPEIPSIPEPKKIRTSQKKDQSELSQSEVSENVSPTDSPSKPRKRLSHFNPDFSSISRLTTKLREIENITSKGEIPSVPSAGGSTRSSRSSSYGKPSIPEAIKPPQKAPSQLKDIDREKNTSKRYSRSKSKARENN